MAHNNNAYFNAAFAGAAQALIHTATISNTSQEFVGEVVNSVATEIDLAIAVDEGVSVAKANLLQGIVAGAMAGRSATSLLAASYAEMAAGIAATYSTLKAGLA